MIQLCLWIDLLCITSLNLNKTVIKHSIFIQRLQILKEEMKRLRRASKVITWHAKIHEYGKWQIMPFLAASGSKAGFLLAAQESWIKAASSCTQRSDRKRQAAGWIELSVLCFAMKTWKESIWRVQRGVAQQELLSTYYTVITTPQYVLKLSRYKAFWELEEIFIIVSVFTSCNRDGWYFF